MISAKIRMVLLVSSNMAAGAMGLTVMRLMPPVQAAPVVSKPAAPASPLGDLFAGKPFPLTVPVEKMEGSYHLVALVDAQGKASLYATEGQTTAAGSETYLVAYEVTLTDPKAGSPPQIKPGTKGQIIFINLHAIQAMGGIVPIQIAPPEPVIAPATP